jgi:hypothetical protein
MEDLKVYLIAVIESLKDEDEAYLKGYTEAHRDILKRIEKDGK